MASQLKRERLQRSPIGLPTQRCEPLPPGVVSITSRERLPVGSVAVIVAAQTKDTEPRQNIGKQVVVVGHTRGAFPVRVDSLGGPLALDGGGISARDIRYRPANLRRLWTELA